MQQEETANKHHRRNCDTTPPTDKYNKGANPLTDNSQPRDLAVSAQVVAAGVDVVVGGFVARVTVLKVRENEPFAASSGFKK